MASTTSSSPWLTQRFSRAAVSTSSAPVRSRSGLTIVPETRTEVPPMDRELPALEAVPSAESFVKAIDGIYRLYGRNTAYGVALNFEYPLIPKCPVAKEAQTK